LARLPRPPTQLDGKIAPQLKLNSTQTELDWTGLTELNWTTKKPRLNPARQQPRNSGAPTLAT